MVVRVPGDALDVVGVFGNRVDELTCAQGQLVLAEELGEDGPAATSYMLAVWSTLPARM